MIARRFAPRAFVALVALACAGCFPWGPGPERIKQGPAGVQVQLHLVSGAGASTAFAGELVAVHDTALLLNRNGRLGLVPMRAIRRAELGPAAIEIRNGRLVDDVPLDSIRPLARHPYGLSREQLETLARANGQDRLWLVVPERGVVLDALALQAVPELGRRAGRGFSQVGHGAHGAAAHVDASAFLDSVRAAVPNYARVEDAIAAGYRQLGPHFPGMGEHWIQPGLIVAGRVDPQRPPVLSYADIGGERRLVGVAFTVPLLPGEEPPAYPAGREVWHDHSARVDEEVLLLAHPATHRAGGERPRLAMFHVWMPLHNPAGVFAQNNWLLPFEQAGLTVAAGAPSADAGRALSLAVSGPDYHAALFDAATPLSPAERARLRRMLERTGRDVREWLEGQRGRPVQQADLIELEREWARLWSQIRTAVDDADWRRLRDVAGPLGPLPPAPLRPERIGLKLSAGNGFYTSARALGVVGLSGGVRFSNGWGAHAQLERSSPEVAQLICHPCRALRQEQTLLLWHVGVDRRLIDIGRSGELRSAVGLGGLELDVDDLGGLALFGGLWATLPMADAFELGLELNVYAAQGRSDFEDAFGETWELYPALRVSSAWTYRP